MAARIGRFNGSGLGYTLKTVPLGYNTPYNLAASSPQRGPAFSRLCLAAPAKVCQKVAVPVAPGQYQTPGCGGTVYVGQGNNNQATRPRSYYLNSWLKATP